jgi:hypothetical protein
MFGVGGGICSDGRASVSLEGSAKEMTRESALERQIE